MKSIIRTTNSKCLWKFEEVSDCRDSVTSQAVNVGVKPLKIDTEHGASKLSSASGMLAWKRSLAAILIGAPISTGQKSGEII